VVALQETDLKFYEEKRGPCWQGYSTVVPKIKQERDLTRMLLLVKKGIDFMVRDDLMDSSFCSIWIEVVLDHRKIVIGTFYREWNDGSNDKSIEYQMENLCHFLSQVERARRKSECVVCLGDMNIDLNKEGDTLYSLRTLLSHLLSTLSEHGLKNIMLGDTYTATRLREDGTLIHSALDHLYISKEEEIMQVQVLGEAMSDHMPILVELGKKKRCRDKNTLRKRDFKHFNLDTFNLDLAMQPWETLTEAKDVDDMVECFNKLTNCVLDRHAPFKDIKIITKRKKIQLSEECNKARRERDDLLKALQEAVSEERLEALHAYKKKRNLVTALVRKDKQKKVAQELHQDPSIKNIWRIVNEHIQSRKETETLVLAENGEEIQEEKRVADVLNDFFVQKTENLRGQINRDNQEDPMTKLNKIPAVCPGSFLLRPVHEQQVVNIIKKLKAKKSHGFDSISSDLLKKSATILCVPLTKIINESILTGKFPALWKQAIIRPLLKKGSIKEKSNYRPISLLSVPSMILEKVVKYQVQNYCEINGLLGSTQHGFRNHRSTTSALLEMHCKWNLAADNKKSIGVLLYDLSAAFDSLDADILVNKLERYGFDGRSTRWFKSYLGDRKQRVKVGSKLSEQKMLPYGAPQGSCLSPLLFIIMVADMNLWLENSEVFSFADDTSQSVVGDNLADVCFKLEEEAGKLEVFLASNNLVLNPTKTCCLLNKAGRAAGGQVVVAGERIIGSKSTILLGLKITASFNWSEQFEEVLKCLNQRLYIIHRLTEVLPKAQLKIVGEALFNSKIRYGIAVYGGVRLEESESVHHYMQQLQIMQNKMMRVILKKRLADHIPVRKLLEETGFLSVNQMSVQHVLNETFKIVRYDTVPYISKLFQKQESVYQTRAQEQGGLRKEISRHKKRMCFVQNAVRVWNYLPIEMRFITKQSIFAEHVRKCVVNIPL
jgi:hypothetical protein